MSVLHSQLKEAIVIIESHALGHGSELAARDPLVIAPIWVEKSPELSRWAPLGPVFIGVIGWMLCTVHRATVTLGSFHYRWINVLRIISLASGGLENCNSKLEIVLSESVRLYKAKCLEISYTVENWWRHLFHLSAHCCFVLYEVCWFVQDWQKHTAHYD